MGRIAFRMSIQIKKPLENKTPIIGDDTLTGLYLNTCPLTTNTLVSPINETMAGIRILLMINHTEVFSFVHIRQKK